MNNTMKMQLEMTFNRVQFPRTAAPRRHRARWWFQQMRQVVEAAVDWKPAPPARPEQTCLSFTK
jgi:hypothetical protein